MLKSQFQDKTGKKWSRVSKNVARKLFNNGQTIFFIPCKANPTSAWDIGMVIPPKKNNNPKEKVFDQVCDAFEYYNCNSNELGRRANFYV